MDSDSSRPAPTDPTQPARSRRSWLLPAVFGFIVVVGAALVTAREWQRRRHSAPANDPSARFTSPFLNVTPGVKYVGSARCAECHIKEAATYAEHPMGRSVFPANQELPRQRKAKSDFEASGLHYSVERRSNKIFYREFVASEDGRARVEVVAEAAFAVGSGRQGQSFLVNRDGYLFQSPISWYSQEEAWRLSPSFDRNNEHFSRPITEPCLFCHTNEARTEPDTVNRYRPADLQLEPIGCERCHGPGELHVAARLSRKEPAGKDLTIVNPSHLESPLREAVCQQCHLPGEARIVRRGKSLYDFRPGLPLHEFLSVFVHPRQADGRKAVSHVEQMYLSRCFQASGEKMGCISCHDPHVFIGATKRVPYYRQRCLQCHDSHPCSLPVAARRRQQPDDSCIDCHMPRGDSSNIAHTSVTDHRILRRPDRAVPDDNPTNISLVPFSRGPIKEGGGDDSRDLGLALGEMLDRPLSEPQRRQLAHEACKLLDRGMDRTSNDVAALEGLGLALWKDKQTDEALAILDKALQQAPRRELALERAARITMERREFERSVVYWRRLIEVSPYNWRSHGFLAQTLALQQQWAAAVDACRAALRLNPFEVRTRMLLIDCLIRRGQKKQAREEFDLLLAPRPAESDQLRRWFEQLLRSNEGSSR